ncbi:MAG: trigger factor [Dehalococcoidia bacterium]
MKVSTERLPQSQIALQIEVDDERLASAKTSAYRRIAAKTRIPGFRPGKAPREVVERHVGEHTIFHEAVDRLLPQVYQEALEQESIDPIDRAEYEMVTEEPLVVKFTVPVRPEIDLGDYGSIRIAREPVVVEPERIQENLEALRRRYATLEPATRPIQWGDVVRADVQGTVDGTALVNEEDAEFQLNEGRPISLPGFAEALLGTEKGATLDFDVTAPEEVTDERLRGKTAHYQVQIKEVKQEVLPELDDEFARQVGEGFSDLAALRSRVEENLRQGLEQEAEHKQHDAILEALVGRAKIEYPPVLLDRETARLLREQTGTGASQADLERYLQQAGKSEADLQEELRPLAETRLSRSLVLSQVAEAEHIEVTDSEVEAEIERLTSGAGDQAEEVRRLFSEENAKESLRRTLMTRKTLDRLVEIASSDGTEPEAVEAGAADAG